MAQLRILGVRGKNLPTKQSLTVRASDFSIGGIIGKFERSFAKSYQVKNIEEFRTIFGEHVSSSNYGWDAVQGFFDNILGVTGSLFVKAHVGYTGSAIDAVVASANLNDQAGSPQATLNLKAGYLTEQEYGVGGNRTGYQVVNGYRFSTVFAATALAAATSAVLDSVADIKVGDIIQFVLTGGGGATVYKKITAVAESTNTVTWVGALHGSATAAIGDTAKILGFQLKTYRKSITGIVTEVSTELGKIWCTMEPEVVDYYVNNVHASNQWLIAADLAVTETNIQEAFPANVSTTTYLASGADGTSPTTAAHWSADITALANNPIRFLANPETTDETIQKAMETAMQARQDNPKVLVNIASNRTKAQLLDIGHRFQRSDATLFVITANWLYIVDPFSTSPIAPPRAIPNVGHIMGAWVRVIGQNGVHFVPALKSNPLLGITGIVGEQLLDDQDRTDVANAGVNMIQFIQGFGNIIRNFFTASTNEAFQFANGLLMREFIKVSAVDSLQTSENTPNSLGRIKQDRSAVLNFLYRLWFAGSTGTVPVGETFGQGQSDDGTPNSPEQHFEVQADNVNNPADKVRLGERNIDVWFTFPAPAGSIQIGVGILLKN